MKVEMVMPQMGESIVEGTIVRWVKKPGDLVSKDENVLEISTDKVDSEIPSPAAGRLLELKANEGDTVPVGAVIAILDTDVAAGAAPAPSAGGAPATEPAARAAGAPGGTESPAIAAAGATAGQGTPATKTPAPQPAAPRPAPPAPQAGTAPREDDRLAPAPDLTLAPPPAAPAPGVSAETAAPGQAPVPPPPPPAPPSGPSPAWIAGAAETGREARFYSPLVRSIARQESIPPEELATIPGTGRDGRLTRDDLLSWIERRKAGAPAAAAPVQAPAAAAGVAATAYTTAPPMAAPREAVPELDFAPYPKYTVAESRTTPEGPVEVVQMDRMRQLIAEHMVRSKATSPHVASVTEVDMTRVVRFREARKAEFEAQHGFKLTYTPIIAAAAVRALIDYPMVNSSVEGTQVLIKRFVNLGIAVALENGLIVPVVKHAEEKNFLGLARAINDLAARARTKKLMPDDVQGVTFSVTNMGGFGNLFGIPIINQPSVAILGVGAIVKRPVVVEDAIAIRNIMYLSLSYDHRVIDGALGGYFIQRVRHYLEKVELTGGI